MLEALQSIWGFIEALGVIFVNAISTVVLTVELVAQTVALPAELILFMPSILATACIVYFAIFALKFILQFLSSFF